MKKFFYILLSVSALFAVGSFVHDNYNKWQQKVQPININGTIVSKPKNIPNFTLNSGNGQTFDDSKLLSNWSIMFFGYTRCPDICPTTLNTLSTMYKNLNNVPKHQMPKIIFVSIDSDHDHDQKNEGDNKAAKYSQYFNNNFIGLTGSKAQIDELTKGLGVVVQKINNDSNDPENYVYDHSSTLYVINPRGQLQAILTAPHKPEELAKNIKSILNKFG
jgi:protein SCO1/2